MAQILPSTPAAIESTQHSHDVETATQVEAVRGEAALQSQLVMAETCSPAMTQVDHPSTTPKVYLAKQREFLRWCATKPSDPLTRDTVTGPKLNLFLEECVIGRPRKRALTAAPNERSKRQKSDRQMEVNTSSSASAISAMTPADDAETVVVAADESQQTPDLDGISYATVDQYVAAVVHLWKEQRARHMNINPNPREGDVKTLLDSLRKKEATSRAKYPSQGKYAGRDAAIQYIAKQFEQTPAELARIDERQLQLALPLLVERMKHNEESIAQQFKLLKLEFELEMAQGFARLENSARNTSDLITSLVSSLGTHFNEWAQQTRSRNIHATSPSSTSQTISTANLFSTPTVGASSDTNIDALGKSSAVLVPQHTKSTFTMCRSLSTCKELWREWTQGLNGGPSVRSQDEQFGGDWRKAEKDRKFYSRRLTIIEKISQIQTDHDITGLQAAQVLDLLRKQLHKTSLAVLEDVIKKKQLPAIEDISTMLLKIAEEGC